MNKKNDFDSGPEIIYWCFQTGPILHFFDKCSTNGSFENWKVSSVNQMAFCLEADGSTEKGGSLPKTQNA